jgi:hypothetical protein
MKNCEELVKAEVPKESTPIQPHQNVIEIMARKYDAVIPNHYFDYYSTFDYEALLLEDNKSLGESSEQLNSHLPVSCSVNSNIPDYDTPRFFCLDEFETVQDMNKAIIGYALDMSRKSLDLMLEKFEDLDSCLDECGADREKFDKYVSQLPLVGFNSQKYDLNMVKSYGIHNSLVNDGMTKCVKRGNAYMTLPSDNILLLDVCNYLPPCTYAKYLKAYKCEQKKGFFPYEYMDSLEKLKETQLPCIEAFYSQLKGSNSLGANPHEIYNNHLYLRHIWRQEQMKTLKDLLRWYNNLDVGPFVEAIAKQRDSYKEHGYDMFKDGLSVSGFGEKLMTKMSWGDFKENPWQYLPSNSEARPDLKKNGKGDYELKISDRHIEQKIASYKEQDKERSPNGYTLTVKGVRGLLRKSNHTCNYCAGDCSEKFTLDRKDNEDVHVIANCVIACKECNVRRGTQSVGQFKYKLCQEAYLKEHPQIWTIDDKEAYDLIQEKGKLGGPSVVFHRYHEKWGTKIKRSEYDTTTKQWSANDNGKWVRPVTGFDANALYLWCLGQEMPTGKQVLIKDNIDLGETTEQIKNGELFGFVELDLHVPESLYTYFGEMPRSNLR